MFKNIIAYAVRTPDYRLTHDMLARREARPCGALERTSDGFVTPCSHASDGLVHLVNGGYLFCWQTESRLLPGSVVDEAVKIRVEAVEDQQGHFVGRKQRREIKEQIVDELLPKSFVQHRNTLVFMSDRFLLINTSSQARAEALTNALVRVLDDSPLDLIRVVNRPVSVMSMWLLGETPEGITVDDSVALEMPAETRASINYKRVKLDETDMSERLSMGYMPRSVAVTLNDRVSFRLHDDMSLKRVSLTDIVVEAAEEGATNGEEIFDANVILDTTEITSVLDFVIGACGGIAPTLLDGAKS